MHITTNTVLHKQLKQWKFQCDDSIVFTIAEQNGNHNSVYNLGFRIVVVLSEHAKKYGCNVIFSHYQYWDQTSQSYYFFQNWYQLYSEAKQIILHAESFPMMFFKFLNFSFGIVNLSFSKIVFKFTDLMYHRKLRNALTIILCWSVVISKVHNDQ